MTHTPRHSEGRRTRARAATKAVVIEVFNRAAMANPIVWWAVAGLGLVVFAVLTWAVLAPADIDAWAAVLTFLKALIG